MTAAGVAGHQAGGTGEQVGGTASIGSVLDGLRAEFPEITISKIRFLESEGLISPARTPSGYRQFAPADVTRLRFVLSAQRDHYLPLKVIRAKLEEFDRAPTPGGPTLAGEPVALATPAEAPASAPAADPWTTEAGGRISHGGPGGRGSNGASGRPRSGGPVPAVASAPDPTVPSRREQPLGATAPPVDAIDAPTTDAATAAARPVERDALLTLEGVDDALLEGLASHGVLRPDPSGRYDPEAPFIARTAAALAALGVEPRLLRGLRAGADREVGLLSQLVTPVARGRAPEAAERAEALSRELATLSGRLHALLVATGLRDGRR